MALEQHTKYYEFLGAKPCPFCGSDEIFIESAYDGHLFSAYCHNCFIKQSGYVTEAEAKEKWNTRA